MKINYYTIAVVQVTESGKSPLGYAAALDTQAVATLEALSSTEIDQDKFWEALAGQPDGIIVGFEAGTEYHVIPASVADPFDADETAEAVAYAESVVDPEED